ncbi:hypothetical protein [Pedobacter mucosus]|uniref:hypothetical protein n=1 Tax=Pedobacter mucosus TaxID=2895286 RepID=UPI001EE4B0BA|nr:hypothetical protein [Pedobacter mucosus]UKT63426.1 hypothetical protein LOK61_16850 [Pedobacter mucosus]
MKLLLLALFICFTVDNFIFPEATSAQEKYVAPQDTSKKKLSNNVSLSKTVTENGLMKLDSRLYGAAVRAAEILKDTLKYDQKKGIALRNLFTGDDLTYVSNLGINNVISLFEQVNKHLPNDQKIDFIIDSTQATQRVENPLVLKDLRVRISAHPALIENKAQWKENIFQAYMARDYATKLNNTITITSATREIRETPALELINYNGSPITLASILSKENAKNKNRYQAEAAAVKAFRLLTFPNAQLSKENANENYRRALFTLIDLQAKDFDRNPVTRPFIDQLAADLSRGSQSNVIKALKNSNFFDVNVPGSVGPVLLTESDVINPANISSQSRDKAMELLTLTALHYGERDAVKLLSRLEKGQGALPAKQTNDFTVKRLSELTFHGTEKIKSLGFEQDKTAGMTMADLVLVAVAAPDTPVIPQTNASLTVLKVGNSIINNYYSTVTTQENKNTFLLNPRISVGTRHIEYRAAFDAVDYVPEFVNGMVVPQDGSKIVQNGIEFRFESDIYFSNYKKIAEKGIKPWVYPEFGIIIGGGTRKVGYDSRATPGVFGPVPQYKQGYVNWGSHIGLTAGPVLLGFDATVLSTSTRDNPYERFFDLSQAMTYFRYSFLARILNLGLGNANQRNPYNIIFDFELAGETNNEGTFNRLSTQNGASQTGSPEWYQDNLRAHPNGVLDKQIATDMILNGDVKASYAASNFGALHLGLEKSGFLFKVTAGLYNLKAIKGYDESRGEWIKQLVKNTVNGNAFGTVSLTYNFGSKSVNDKYRRSEKYHTTNGINSKPEIEESSSAGKTTAPIRNRAIFMNRRK